MTRACPSRMRLANECEADRVDQFYAALHESAYGPKRTYSVPFDHLVGAGAGSPHGWRSWVGWRLLIGACWPNPASPVISRKSSSYQCWNRTKATFWPSAGANTATARRRTDLSPSKE